MSPTEASTATEAQPAAITRPAANRPSADLPIELCLARRGPGTRLTFERQQEILRRGQRVADALLAYAAAAHARIEAIEDDAE